MATDPNVIPFPTPEARAASFINEVRNELGNSTFITPQALLKIIPDVLEQALAYIFSELDYERNLKCNTAIAVRLLAVCAARVKDSKSLKNKKRKKSMADSGQL